MNRWVQAGLVVLVLAGGVVVARTMFALAPSADAAAPETTRTPVRVAVVQPGRHTVTVEGTGTVQASTQIDLVPQVSGRVERIAEGLTPGARFQKGALIAAIEDVDYAAAAATAEANVATARLNLALEEGRAAAAVREAELAGQSASSPLQRREPQLVAMRAALASAEAQLRTAERNLARTRLVAPFDAVVLSESLDVGQTVGAAAPVARLMGTEKFRVRVSLPVHTLVWLPTADASDTPTRATVVQTLADGGRITREGVVERRLGELDPETRTAAVLVSIRAPLDADGALPLLPGAYVDVTLEGQEVDGVFEVPRAARVDGGAGGRAGPDDTLQRATLDIAWGTATHVYAREGLEPGARVVTSTLSLPVAGMPLAVVADDPTAAR